jgi:hypothetical protein
LKQATHGKLLLKSLKYKTQLQFDSLSVNSLFLHAHCMGKSVYWRDGRAVECGGLENRCPLYGGPGVRIPLSPQAKTAEKSTFSAVFYFGMFFIFLAKWGGKYKVWI